MRRCVCTVASVFYLLLLFGNACDWRSPVTHFPYDCRVVVKESGGINGLDFAALRFSIAALAFLPFLPGALAKDPATGERVILKAGLELSVWTALGYLTQTLGLMTTDASRASFLSTFTVCFMSGGCQSTVWLTTVPLLPPVWHALPLHMQQLPCL